MGTSIYETAMQYREKGIEIIPILKEEKKPACRYGYVEYGLKSFSDNELKAIFTGGDFNIGAVFGQCSNNLMDIDIDSIEAAEKWKEPLSDIIKKTVTYKTSKPGRSHILLKTKYPLIKNPWKLKDYPENNIDTKNCGFALLPGSIVNGKEYKYINQNDMEIYELDDLSEIPFPLKQEFKENLDAAFDMQHFDNKKERYLLKNGQAPESLMITRSLSASNMVIVPWALFNILKGNPDSLKQYAFDRSRAEYCLLLYLINVYGFSLAQSFSFFERHAVENTHFNSCEPGEIRQNKYQHFKDNYETACKWLQNNPSPVDLEIDLIHKAIDSNVWKGRRGNSQLAISKGLLQLARICGKTKDIEASNRLIAEYSGINFQTVSNNLKASSKVKHPIIDFTGGINEKYLTKSYNFNIDNCKKLFIMDKPLQEGGVKGLSIINKNTFTGAINHDLFWNKKGIGKTGYKIYKTLYEYGTLSIKDIIEITGISLDAVYKKLRIMTGYSIALRQDKQFSLNPAMNLDQAAGVLGVAGKGDKQKRQHKQDRDKFKADREAYIDQAQCQADGSVKH